MITKKTLGYKLKIKIKFKNKIICIKTVNMKNTFFFVWTAVKIINMCCGDLKTTFVYIHHGNQLTFFRQHQFFFVIYSISTKNRNFNV
jgi:hypothetical protein